MVYDANYWNTKWAQAPIVYTGRALRGQRANVGTDVRNFIITNDVILQQIIKQYGLKKIAMNDTALACQKWVVQFLYYKDDQLANQCPEFWQFPFETLEMGTGDCEDGAILMASLMTSAGIPAYRVKVCAGYVQESPTAPQGGHCYCIYLADKKDGQDDQCWVILDWCYAEDSQVAIEAKPLAKNGGQQNMYRDVWFTFNNENSWNQSAISIAPRIANRDLQSISQAFNVDVLQSIMNFIKAKYNA